MANIIEKVYMLKIIRFILANLNESVVANSKTQNLFPLLVNDIFNPVKKN